MTMDDLTDDPALMLPGPSTSTPAHRRLLPPQPGPRGLRQDDDQESRSVPSRSQSPSPSTLRRSGGPRLQVTSEEDELSDVTDLYSRGRLYQRRSTGVHRGHQESRPSRSQSSSPSTPRRSGGSHGQVRQVDEGDLHVDPPVRGPNVHMDQQQLPHRQRPPRERWQVRPPSPRYTLVQPIPRQRGALRVDDVVLVFCPNRRRWARVHLVRSHRDAAYTLNGVPGSTWDTLDLETGDPHCYRFGVVREGHPEYWGVLRDEDLQVQENLVDIYLPDDTLFHQPVEEQRSSAAPRSRQTTPNSSPLPRQHSQPRGTLPPSLFQHAQPYIPLLQQLNPALLGADESDVFSDYPLPPMSPVDPPRPLRTNTAASRLLRLFPAGPVTRASLSQDDCDTPRSKST